MAVAYTPGLRVTAEAVVRRSRRLPMKGQVLVTLGQLIGAEAIIARAKMPGVLHTIRAAQMLHVEPQELESHLVKRSGEEVAAGEVIAMTKGMWGLFKTEVRAPIAGLLEEVSAISGHARIRERPRQIEVISHLASRVVEVMEGEGAMIEARGALIQGIFGVGGERRGRLRIVGQRPSDSLTAEALGDCRGCVLVAGAGADGKTMLAAAESGAVGLVVGAIKDEALRNYLGYEIGVAITGQEEIPMTVILTEGFGELAMAARTWKLLSSLEGQLASIDGATQIRAGVIRPEIIVTREASGAEGAETPTQMLAVGSRVRVIREPNFGLLGEVTDLPVALTQIETESSVRVATVKLDNGNEVQIPRANLEIIQE